MSANLLAHETSPYLLQHKDNPVYWMPWGEAAFERARTEGKPILLSIGYAACHWCHVMAHESFENPEIADVMNDLFVSIKVDREERPDLDTIYQSALALLGQSGGWPLTMFLTPDGEPFWGGTYFPPTTRYGRPGFPEVLRGVSATFHQEPDKVTRNVSALGEALEKLAGKPIRRRHHARHLQPGRRAAGAGSRSFPRRHRLGAQVPADFPVHLAVACVEADRADALQDSRHQYPDADVQGGIYDHLGGGFARYSTDERWLAPHFEKMLYDNAQLIDLATLVWQETGDKLYETRIRETVGWVLREMLAQGPMATVLPASPARSMPTAKVRRGASMSGRSRRSTASSGQMRRHSNPSTTSPNRGTGKDPIS